MGEHSGDTPLKPLDAVAGAVVVSIQVQAIQVRIEAVVVPPGAVKLFRTARRRPVVVSVVSGERAVLACAHRVPPCRTEVFPDIQLEVLLLGADVEAAII